MTNHTPDAAVEARIDARIHEQLDYWIAQLARLCAQPSISAQRLGIEGGGIGGAPGRGSG